MAGTKSKVETKRVVLTVKEVAAILGTSEQTVWNMIADGKLPGSRRVGAGHGHWRIPRTAHPYLAEA